MKTRKPAIRAIKVRHPHPPRTQGIALFFAGTPDAGMEMGADGGGGVATGGGVNGGGGGGGGVESDGSFGSGGLGGSFIGNAVTAIARALMAGPWSAWPPRVSGD